MTAPVTYVELNSPSLEATAAFMADVFGWEPQPFAAPDCVDSIDALRKHLESAGGTVVVEPFSMPGVGMGCYVTDPAGLLIGLHEYDVNAR